MLGPLEVRTDDGYLADVPGARLRALLIALALKPGRVVQKASLVDWIWGEQPPADATNALQRLVSRLRKALPDGVIEGQPDGYRLMVDPDDVDAVRRTDPPWRSGAAPRAGRPPRRTRRGHARRPSARQARVRRGGRPARGAAPDRHGGSVRR